VPELLLLLFILVTFHITPLFVYVQGTAGVVENGPSWPVGGIDVLISVLPILTT
jgi:hypothetical protein